MGGMSQGAREGGVTHAHGWAVCHKEPGKDNCSCVIFIPHIHVGKGGVTHAYMDVGKGREQERKLCPWMGAVIDDLLTTRLF